MNSLSLFFWLQFVCLEMCTYASLNCQYDTEKTEQISPQDQFHDKKNKTKTKLCMVQWC